MPVNVNTSVGQVCCVAENQGLRKHFYWKWSQRKHLPGKCLFLIGKSPSSEALLQSSADEIDSSFGNTLKFKAD